MKPLAQELVRMAKQHQELSDDLTGLASRVKKAAEGTDALSAFLTIEDDEKK